MATYNPARKYGMHLTLAPSDQTVGGAGASNGAVTGGAKALLDPENPMLWLLGIGAATLGLIAFNTSVRVGPVHASGGIGKGK
jgi:hypothetical protein